MSVKTLPYFKWYPADAETDEVFRAMSDAQKGFFLRCLNQSWLNNGLPSDLSQLAKSMYVSPAYLSKMWKVVGLRFNIERDGRLYNGRQEEERSKAIQKSESATNSVRTRYERRSNEPLRAYESEYVSESGSSASEGEKESEKKGNFVPPMLDEYWHAFEVACAPMGAGSQDLKEAWEIYWQFMDSSVRQKAIEGLTARADNPDDPVWNGLPAGYLKGKKWERTPKPPRTNGRARESVLFPRVEPEPETDQERAAREAAYVAHLEAERKFAASGGKP